MKALIALAAGLMAATSAHADPVSCSGQVSYPVQVVTGTCVQGRCSGTLPSLNIPVTGSCSDNSSFNATAGSAVGTMTGRCHDGQFYGIGSAEVLDFNGTCAANVAFKGSAFVRPQWTSGTCSEDGPFNATVTAWSVVVEGTCGTQ